MFCDQRFDFFSEHGHKECRRLLIKRIFIIAVQGGNQFLYTLVASCRFLLRWFRGCRRIGYFRGADSDGQIQLCTHIIEHIAVTAAGQRPELACIGRGVLQHQRTVDNGQTLTVLSREGIPAGVVISQRQRWMPWRCPQDCPRSRRSQTSGWRDTGSDTSPPAGRWYSGSASPMRPPAR